MQHLQALVFSFDTGKAAFVSVQSDGLIFHTVAGFLCCAMSRQACLTLCEPMDCSPSDSSVGGFSRQEHWTGLLCPPPGHLPRPGMEAESLASLALAGRLFTVSPLGESLVSFAVPEARRDLCSHSPDSPLMTVQHISLMQMSR